MMESHYDIAIFIWNISLMSEMSEIEAWQWEGWVLPKEDKGA